MEDLQELIKKVKDLLDTVEGYISRGHWNPDGNEASASALVKSDVLLSQLMATPRDVLSSQQVTEIGHLKKRRVWAAQNLLSPPWAN